LFLGWLEEFGVERGECGYEEMKRWGAFIESGIRRLKMSGVMIVDIYGTWI
jgi:hypothetical protein